MRFLSVAIILLVSITFCWNEASAYLSHQSLIKGIKQARVSGEVRGDGDTLIEENAPFECPANTNIAPHPTRCDWYYTCYRGETVKLWWCYSNWLFDLTYSGCNFPEQTDCGTRDRPTNSGTTIPAPSSVDVTSTTSPSTNPSTPYVFSCPTQDGFYPLTPTACSDTFWTCISGNAYTSRCPVDYVFDVAVQTCVPAAEASCNQQ